MPTYRVITKADKETVKRAIDALAEGKHFDVSIKKHTHKRSIPQNRTYWMWLNCIHDETGNNINDLHDAFRSMYLGYVTREVLGRHEEKLRSTTDLSVGEFVEYMNKIQAFVLSELAITLPNPEDAAWYEFFERYGHE